MRKTLFSILIIFLLGTAVFAVPSSGEVREELAKLLKDDEPVRDDNNFNLGDFFSSMSPLFRVLIIAGFSGVILYLGFLLAKRFSQKNYAFNPQAGSDDEDDPERPARRMGLPDIYSEAVKKAGAGDYDLAVLLLHQYSVTYLFQKNILQHGREYTNREIKWIIKDKGSLYDAFYQLALESEKIAFNEEHESAEKFESLHEGFKREFLEK